MNEDILNLPPRKRRMIAVQRFKHITGEYYWNRLLRYLDITEDEFIEKYGDELVSDPNACNHILVEMLMKSVESLRCVP